MTEELEKFALEIKQISPAKLAELRRGRNDDDERAILIDKEFEERDRIHQHELDLILLDKQAKLMKSSVKTGAIWGIVGTLLGAILGAIISAMLPIWLKGCSSQQVKSQVQRNITSSTSVHHKIEAEKSLEDTVSRKPPMKK